MMRIFLLIVLYFLLQQCSSIDKPKQLELIERYLKEVQRIDVQQTQHALLLQIGICGSCDVEVFDFIKNEFKFSSCPLLIILAQNDETIQAKIKEDFPNATMLIDEDQLLPRYGLRFARDAYFTFNAGKAMSYCELGPQKFSEVTQLHQSTGCLAASIFN